MIEATAPFILINKDDLNKLLYTVAVQAAEEVIKRFNSEDELWDSDRIAKYLGVSQLTVQNDWSHRAGFPQALIFGSGSKAKRRWNPEDVRKWADRQKPRA